MQWGALAAAACAEQLCPWALLPSWQLARTCMPCGALGHGIVMFWIVMFQQGAPTAEAPLNSCRPVVWVRQHTSIGLAWMI